MTRKAGKSHSAVERLIEQRRQYKDWLIKLDAEAATAAPSHVADRVREDYAARLESVTKELSQHEDGVRQALMETAAHVEALVQERQARTDELAEARLRRQVGEFSEDRFEEVQERCKSALADLTKEIATSERDIERLEEVLAQIEGKPAEEPARAAPPAPPTSSAEPPAEAPAAAPALTPAAAPKPAAGGQMSLDELEFLRSVVEAPKAPAPARASVVASAIPAAAQPAAPPAPAKAPELPPPPPPPPPPAAPRAAEPPKAVEPPPPPKPPISPAPAPKAKERRPSETPGAAEANPKTLKCSECGTMNAPTEWYCEKCGAELSTF